jgi:hypothetical protein
MAPTRPSAAQAADPTVDRPRGSGGGGRLATVAVDFLLDPEQRLTEQERALMTGMLLTLAGTLADEIRVRLPDDLAQDCECPADEIVGALRRAGLLRNRQLIALLLRRADEARISDALGAASSPLQAWTADETPRVAAAAMAVVLARAAARDRFGRPGLELGDCDAETAVHLSYSVGAALAVRAPHAEEAIVAATVDLLGRHDEGQRLHALEAKLMIALGSAGRLDEKLLTTLAIGGEASLLAQALGRLSGVTGEIAWNMLLSPTSGNIAQLLRMAGQPRNVAATLLAALTLAVGRIDPADEINRFDRLGEAEVADLRARLRLPPAFGAALHALANRNG